MPASNTRAIEKARTLPADAIIFDLEDAVAPEMKEEARAAAVAAVKAGGFGEREVAIRINGRDSEWSEADCAAVAASGADAVVVPKVSSPEDVHFYEKAFAAAPDTMQLWAMIETCASILAIAAIAACAADTRLSLFIVGLNDLAKEMRARPGEDRMVFLPALTASVMAARAHGLTVIDSVCNEFRDIDRFESEARQGLSFGFDGKSLIHPAQVEPCNAVFSPSPKEIDDARAIIEAFAQPENAGKGAIQVNGKMAELLHRDQAERTIAIADAIAARSA